HGGRLGGALGRERADGEVRGHERASGSRSDAEADIAREGRPGRRLAPSALPAAPGHPIRSAVEEGVVELPHKHALFGPRFFAHLGGLLRLYWTSPDAPRGGLLLATTVALELATVYGAVLLSDVQRRLFDAFEARDVGAFSTATLVFLGTIAFFVLASTYRTYLRGALEIRWRRWLTGYFLEQWMNRHAYCAMEMHRQTVDNPDQRIAEDVREFVASALGLSLSLLAAV